MAGSSIGDIFKITTWGESHGKALGVVVDGCPAGLELCEADIQTFLNRRKPGQSKFTTQRKEDDQVEILSGVFNGVTTGTPISLIVFNKDQHSNDYSKLSDVYRPGHADYTFDEKFGIRDYRGGGRSSGRETIGRVAAGAIAVKLLHSLGIEIFTYTKAIGDIEIDYSNSDFTKQPENKLYMPDEIAYEKAVSFLSTLSGDGDSSGGLIECLVEGMPIGVGEPVFDKLDANLAKAVMSIGAVKGVEIGEGFSVSKSIGSENNDSFTISNGNIIKVTNNSGGTLGGMSDGSIIKLTAAIKPTPSIYKEQTTVNKNKEQVLINIEGRHDPVIVPRAVVVVESMVALTITDLLLKGMSSKLGNLLSIYKKQ
jgi:chorismate synthase